MAWRRLRFWRTAFAGLLAALLLSAAAGAGERKASGRFEDNKGHWFDVGGAYAFPSKVGLDDEPGIMVAISNAGFRTENIDRLWDRKSFIDRVFSDDETAVAYLLFSAKGEFRGVSYYFESGAGCAHCFDSTAGSTVKLGDDGLAGTVTYKKEDAGYSFDVTFDVPVAPASPGKLIPSGGDAEKAYLSLRRAAHKKDWKTVRKHIDRERLEGIEKDAKEDKEETKRFMEWLSSRHAGDMKILKVFESGDTVTLVLSGGPADTTPRGDVLMKKEDGAWRLYMDNFYAGN